MSYQIELRHFSYFLAVAEELHYRKAAEKLFISQPGLSTQIKQMESILGVKLFERDKKKVSLTAAGSFLKGEVEFIMNHLSQTKRHLKLIDEGHLGEIRIGFLGSAMQKVIPNLLLSLKDKSPEVHTSLEELTNHAQISALLKDKLDIGFVRLARVPSGLTIKPVFRDTFSLVVPIDFHIDERNFMGMHQLAKNDFILFSQDYSSLYYDTIMSICEDAGFTPKVSHKSVHALTIFKLVENRLGISIVPTALQYGFKMNVKFIELKKIKQKAILSAAWKSDNRNPVLQQCLNALFD
ncbi:LysR family transcriptional regulator [uncultured Croceitalea sp.]|uniref:LysR family transcriptional regulator n=1 Tax=uncultured Croceitalea sp. TaxID=1798908 RepID=UPI0033057CAB